MMNRELVIALLICATTITASNWELEVHFHQYDNPTGRKSNGQCCSSQCVCEVEFRICLRPGDYFPDAGPGGRCPYGDFAEITQTYTLANLIQFNNTINDLDNPIIFSAGGALQEVPASGFSLFVRVRDQDSSSNKLIDRVYEAIQGIGSSADSKILTGEFEKVELIISYEVRCQQNYYSIDCSTYCVPSDNSMGHYNCDPSNGNKICLPDYQNPATNCTEVACALVCTGGGGSCSESGECECSQGWSGVDCGTAQCAENCHPEGGYCNVPGECLCNTHWNGTNCGQFLCHLNCSTVGGTCENAGGCNCLSNYTGQYCETDLDPCAHLSPCENEGVCSNEGPNQYSCACPSGYTGMDCEEDIDECKMSPCANQATCINHPGTYQCLCVLGWTGEFCETNIDDCSSQPCQNGGNCSDLIHDYYCTCPVEYVGHNCALLRNECIPNPCQHNGTCVDRTTDYECICSEGYSGKQCENTNSDVFILATPTHTPQQDTLPVGALVGGAVGLVVIVVLLFLVIVFVVAVFIKRRISAKVKISEHNVTRGECEHSAERETYTASSDKPMSGIINPTYDGMDWGNQPWPAGGSLTKHNGFSNSLTAPHEQFVTSKAACSNHYSTNTTEEKVREESFEHVIDNDLYSLESPPEGAKTTGSGEQVQISNEYDYVAWGTTHQ